MGSSNDDCNRQGSKSCPSYSDACASVVGHDSESNRDSVVFLFISPLSSHFPAQRCLHFHVEMCVCEMCTYKRTGLWGSEAFKEMRCFASSQSISRFVLVTEAISLIRFN